MNIEPFIKQYIYHYVVNCLLAILRGISVVGIMNKKTNSINQLTYLVITSRI